MTSSIYELLNNKPKQQSGTNNFQEFLNQFNQFGANFTGDPKEKTLELLRTGKMTQEQFNDLFRTAMQIRQLFN